MSSSECLEVVGLGAAWGESPVLADVTFTVGEGEFVVLMGPNGSGKTTLLRALVGLEQPSSGEVYLRGKALGALPTHRRGIGMLFQEPALFPNRSVWENIAYGLDVARRPRGDVERRVEGMLDLLRLRALSERRPETLSGGERQRVALARTLAPEPPLVLLDEPFASVDAEIRRELRSEFRRALRTTGTAALHVTHDREEGLVLADRVVLLSGGRVVQSGAPEAVFRNPATPDAAHFLGYNVVPGPDGPFAVAPEDVDLAAPGRGDPTGLVTLNGFAGDERVVEVTLSDGSRLEARTRQADGGPRLGETVSVRWVRSVPLGPDPRIPRGGTA
ncbi:MAG TPA: ABC transporter ATP-binding protein [Thermoplasmata archaeon]|nr:ABC transporter ATP-binding protein [Thermoplasmata archaeon]